MVYGEPGGGLSHAFRQMSSATATIDDEKVLGEVLRDKSRAFFRDDAQFKMRMQTMVANTKKVVDEIASDHRKRRINQEVVFDELFRKGDFGKPAIICKGKSNVIMSVVASQGSGKMATTGTKYSYHYQKKGWGPALVYGDTFKAGAFNQRQEKIANAKLPFYGSYTEADPVKIAQEGVDKFKEQNYDLITVDTCGHHQQEASMFEDMQFVAEVAKPDLVMMGSNKSQAACDQHQGFKLSAANGAVITLNNHLKRNGTPARVVATTHISTTTGSGDVLQTSLSNEVDESPKQMGVFKKSTTDVTHPAPGSEGIEQDDDEDDNDDDDDDDEDEDEEEEDYDSKIAAGGDDEEGLEADDDEGEEEEGEDEGEAEDNGEDDGDEEGEDDVEGDEDGDEDQEEEDEENGDQDPEEEEEDEEEVEEESEEDVEDLEPPKKKQK